MLRMLEKIKSEDFLRCIMIAVSFAVSVCFAFMAIGAFMAAILQSVWWFVAMLACAIVCAVFVGVIMYLED